jgi:hypothetical protein
MPARPPPTRPPDGPRAHARRRALWKQANRLVGYGRSVVEGAPLDLGWPRVTPTLARLAAAGWWMWPASVLCWLLARQVIALADPFAAGMPGHLRPWVDGAELGLTLLFALAFGWRLYVRNAAAAHHRQGAVLLQQALRAQGEEQRHLLGAAATALRSALEACPREASPAGWASTQIHLGDALARQAELSERGEAAGLLDASLGAYRAVLRVDKWSNSGLVARAHTGLSRALALRARLSAGRERSALLDEAVAAGRSALADSSQQTSQAERGRRQLALADLLVDRAAMAAEAERTQLLGEAIWGYRSALAIYGRWATPEEWALAQRSLGDALRRAAELTREGQERAALLADAAAAYRAALEIYTRWAAPAHAATIQSDLGATLLAAADLAAGEQRNRLLDETLLAFDAAGKVYTHATAPTRWADIQVNAAMALAKRAMGAEGRERLRLLDEAEATCRAALQVYGAATSAGSHPRTRELHERIQAMLVAARA